MSVPRNITEHVHRFVVACARSMDLCIEDHKQKVMVGKLTNALKAKKIKAYQANPLPCLSNLSLVKDMKLAKDFREFAIDLPWMPSPRTNDKGAHIAIMDFNQLFEMTDVVAGLMYVDIDQVYPEHNHLLAELYFLISGTAHWRYGGNHESQKITAGNVIYNYPYNWHGVKAGPTPVLAMYLQCCE